MKLTKTFYHKKFDVTKNEIITTPKTVTKTFKPSKKLLLTKICAIAMVVIASLGVIAGTTFALIYKQPYYFSMVTTGLLAFVAPILFDKYYELVEKEVKQLNLFAFEETDEDLDNKIAKAAANEYRKSHPIDECIRLYKNNDPLFVCKLIEVFIKICGDKSCKVSTNTEGFVKNENDNII